MRLLKLDPSLFKWLYPGMHIKRWLLGDFARLLNAAGIELSASKVTPAHLRDLVGLIEEGTITTTGAKGVFEVMFQSGTPPREIVQEQGLTQISGADELSGVVEQVIAGNPKPVADFRAGKEEALKALLGLVMRETRGRANPQLATDLLRERLAGGN